MTIPSDFTDRLRIAREKREAAEGLSPKSLNNQSTSDPRRDALRAAMRNVHKSPLAKLDGSKAHGGDIAKTKPQASKPLPPFSFGKPAATKPQKPSTRDALYGTGITKRQLERAQRASDKADAQATLAEQRHELTEQELQFLDDSSSELDWVPPDTMMDPNIKLDESQQAALDGIRNQRFACLIGAAGTGKTTLVKAIILMLRDEYDIQPSDIAIMAFTGRAATNVKRALTREYHPCCDTCHGTLEYTVEFDEFFDKEKDEWRTKRVFRPQRTAFNKFEQKVFIIEESGMLPIHLWNEIYEALPDNARVLMIGDINQLPPVQGRSVLGFAMLQWPTYTLEKIHRQAEGDPIIENAHRILKGQMPLNAPNFRVQEIGDGSLTAFKQILGVVKHLHEIDKFNPIQDALIVPKNVSAIGQRNINEKLVHYFNPPRKIGNAILNPRTLVQAGVDSKVLAVGDKVMLLQNDRERGLTNGMIGVITEIFVNNKFQGEAHNPSVDDVSHAEIDIGDMADLAEDFGSAAAATREARANGSHAEEDKLERQASHVTIVKFQNVAEPVSFEAVGDYAKLSHAYAFTCHKSQGGEYPTVVILCHALDSVMLSREWLYTAVTRAQQRVIIITNQISKRGLVAAVNTQRIRGNTITEKARSFLALQDDNDVSQPLLDEPEQIEPPKVLSLANKPAPSASPETAQRSETLDRKFIPFKF